MVSCGKRGKEVNKLKRRFLYCIIVLITLLINGSAYGDIMHTETLYKSFDIGMGGYYDNIDLNINIAGYVSRYLINNGNRGEDDKTKFISNVANLTIEESEYLLEECESKELDVFLILGLMKLESKFDKRAVGTMGERGLGQLMENTAKPIAKNLGIEYDPDKLFQPEYNIKLFTTQLRYLKKLFDNDVHKVLTAYNRGAYGLEKYMASRSRRENPAISSYSQKVLKFREEIYQEYMNTK